MRRPVQIDVVVGARPNFVKAAPLIQALDTDGRFAARLIHTGQHDHPALSGELFEALSLRDPDIHLGTAGGSQAEQTAKVMIAYESILANNLPNAVIVIGDVNSTLGAALSAKKAVRPLIHLEAGLRSGDRTMPEEINRLAVDAISDRLWAPSGDAVSQLVQEGHVRTAVPMIGNFMIDSLRSVFDPETPPPLDLKSRDYIAVTLHRPGNVDDEARRRGVMQALENLAADNPVIFPAHPRLSRHNVAQEAPSVRFVPPMGYRDFLALQNHAALVITDSGGVQEETSILGTPCLTLRPNTERPITLTQGTNRLTTLENLQADVRAAINITAKPALIDGWDGQAAQRALIDLVTWLDLAS